LADDAVTESKHVVTLKNTKVFSYVNPVVIPFYLFTYCTQQDV